VGHVLAPLVGTKSTVAAFHARADTGRNHLPQRGDDEFFDTPLRALITGSVIGLLGAAGWEGIEVLMSVMGVSIFNALPDTIFDIFLGGAAGAWAADRYLDRIFGRSRTNPHQPRVR
jgi:hypothetical protein